MAVVSLDATSRDDFARHEGSRWRTSDRVTLLLDDVSPRIVSGPWECFSLYFRGPPDAMLGQGSYAFDHDELGSLELFLVPLQPDADGPRYESVVNRANSDNVAAGG
jgi:hypothetical protein